MREPLRILVLAANPVKTNRLALDAEHRLLRNKMRDNVEVGNCELLVEWAARLTDLKERLKSHKPHVVHFAGHGTEDGICLEDDKGECSAVSKAQLAEMFSASGEHLRLVVLNACFSALQADAISQSVDYVVGTKAPVADDTAVRFAAYFYEALAIGKTVREAHYKSQIDLASDGRMHVGQYELLVGSGADDSKPLLPPMLPPTKKNIYGVEIKKARLPNAEFVNVRPSEGSSNDGQGSNEENDYTVKIEDLEVTDGNALFINQDFRR